MELTNKQTLPVDQETAWAALNDIDMLKRCIPGCESMEKTADQQYAVTILAAVGPVKARFKGRLQLSELNPPVSYVLNFDGQGGAAGHGKGSAKVTLAPLSATACELAYTASAQVGGRIAQIGSRLVDLAAQKMAAEFFAAFNAELSGKGEAADAAVEGEQAKSSTWSRLVGTFKKDPSDSST